MNNPVLPFEVNGSGKFYKHLFVDSVVNAWKVVTQQIQTVTAKITGNAQIDGTIIIGGAITIDGANSRISSTGGNLDFDANDLTTTGNISAGNLNVTGGVTATGLAVNGTSSFTGAATFGSGLSASQISAGGLSVSGTTTLSAVVLNDGVTMPPLAGSGKGLIQFNNSGQLTRLDFTSDTNAVLTGSGTFRNISLLVPPDTGWQWIGSDLVSTANNVYVPNSLFVGKSLSIGPFKIKNGGTTDTIRTPVALALVSDAQNISLEADTVRMQKYMEAPNIRSAQLQVTGDAMISNNLSVGGYMTIGTAKLVSNGSYRDTLRTPKELALISDANLIKLESDTVRMTQLVEAGKIASPEGSIDTLSSKEVRTVRLSVSGDIEALGGTVRCNEVTTNSLTTNSTISSPKVITSRITSPDSLIQFGDSSIYINVNSNRITFSPNYFGFMKGLTIGNPYMPGPSGYLGMQYFSQHAHALNSIAIGYNLRITPAANNSIVIGSGIQSGFIGSPANVGWLENNIANSMMIGFNSNIPTLFVGSSSGVGTIGRIGAGTANPQKDFHLYSGSNTSTFRIESNYTGPIDGCSSDVYSTWDLSANSDGSFRVSTSEITDPIATFSCRGNMGLGIVNPQYKLDVCGTIRAKETRVNVLGCDYVFNNGYELPPLFARKKAVLQQKHLFNIATSKEMETEGAELGKTTMGILQNVEEHELYLYNHDERIENLEKENAELKLMYKKLYMKYKELEKKQ